MFKYPLFSQLSRILCAILAMSLLAHCSSKPPIKPKVVTKSINTQQPILSDLQQQLDIATKAINNEQWLAAIEQLVRVNKQLIEQNNWHKALWLANQLQQFELPEKLKTELLFLTLKAEHQLNLTQAVGVTLAQLGDKLAIANIEQKISYYQITIEQAKNQQNADIQLKALLQLNALQPHPSVEQQQQIWQLLSQLSPWQLSLLKQQHIPMSQAWLALIQIANRFAAEPEKFARYVATWQRQYRHHPANLLLPELQQQVAQLPASQYQQIAVLIPLSGKQKAAGLALQQGMLAAFNEPQTLHFIDTNQLDFNQLASQLEQLKIDIVIGPLLKSHVQKLLALSLDIPTLLLNTTTNIKLNQNQYAISMQPEAEAIQAASQLANKHFKHPLVLSHNDAVSKRIAQQFIAQWQNLTEQTPELVFFDQGKAMQQQIQQILDVEQSKARINHLKRRLSGKIKTETRNRRDIDMVHLIGTPTQTRLLKPYIDVNISPFARLIPVYASSRSHGKIADKKDYRDLKGIVFTEMPWLLPSSQQNKTLVQQVNTIWPNRTDNLQRIFALGFDSLNLINYLPKMQQAKYIRYYGQTGIMQLTKAQIITRSLLWGKYTASSVKTTRI